MAILYSGTARYEIEITLASLDSNLVIYERTKSFELDAGTVDHAAALTAKGVLETVFDAVNEADLIKCHIRTIFDTPTAAVTAVGNLFKEAVLSLIPDGGGDKITHTIYAPIDAMVSGKTIINSNVQLLAYLNMFETTGAFSLSDGEKIAADNPAPANQIAASRTRHISHRN